jgi:hypothetical protein
MQTEQLRCLLAVFAFAIAALPLTTSAASMEVCTNDGACGKVHAIAPERMAEIAGKFSIGGEVVGMNLQMTSFWQAANGQNLSGKASLVLVLPGSSSIGLPQANIQTQASASESTSSSVPGGGLVSSGKGMDSVAGAAQLVQVAGDSNSASNLTTIDVSPRTIVLPGGANTPKAEAIAANGAKVAVNFANNGVSLTLNVPGAGAAQQRLTTLNANNILQSIQIATNRQQVMNQLHLQLQVRLQTATVLAVEGFGQSVNMLRGR